MPKSHLSISSKSRSWELRTIDSSMVNQLKEPVIDHAIIFSVNPTLFKNMLADVSVFSKFTHFVADGNGVIYLESKDGDSGNSKSEFADINILKINEIADNQYSLEYIDDVMSAIYHTCESIKVFFSNKKPLLLEFEIKDVGALRYHLGAYQV